MIQRLPNVHAILHNVQILKDTCKNETVGKEDFTLTFVEQELAVNGAKYNNHASKHSIDQKLNVIARDRLVYFRAIT